MHFHPHSILATTLLVASASAQAAGFSAQQVITTAADRANDVYATDLDGDGDIDVLSASALDDKIAWYENQGGGVFGSQQVISTAANGANSIYATDLDGDGDPDVVSASGSDDKVAWYENLGGGSFGPQQVISTTQRSAGSVFAIDLDGDGDADVLCASTSDATVAWYENLGGGTFSSQQTITTAASGAVDVYATDLDGDGDADVLSASFLDDKLAWYENLSGGSFGPQQVISTASTFFTSVHAADLDGDGDMDVVSASRDDAELAWYENLGSGAFGPQRLLTQSGIAGVRSAYTADFDRDGDEDIVAIGSAAFNQVAWFENLGAGTFGPMQAIEPQNSPRIIFGNAVFAADLDGDGDPDVMTASVGDDKISWYANHLSTAIPFGSGCGALAMTLAPTSVAVLNQSMAARVTNTPTTQCTIALGFSRTTHPILGTLPVDLSTLGMTGCTLYQSTETFGLATQPTGTAGIVDWTISVPNQPSLLGLHVYTQALSLAPGANPVGLVTSNSVDWQIGG